MPAGYPTPREVEDSIIEMWLDPDNTRTQRQIAEHHGVTLRQVDRALKRGRERGIDIPKMPQAPRISEEEEARIIAMLEDGTPYVEVARTVGRNPSRLGAKYPGYTLSFSEIASINHMQRQFERLLEHLGLADGGSYSH